MERERGKIKRFAVLVGLRYIKTIQGKIVQGRAVQKKEPQTVNRSKNCKLPTCQNLLKLKPVQLQLQASLPKAQQALKHASSKPA